MCTAVGFGLGVPAHELWSGHKAIFTELFGGIMIYFVVQGFVY